MTATDTLHVTYPAAAADADDELRRLTAEHPGLGRKLKPAVTAARRTAARRVGRSLARGWARVRGTLGSLAGIGTACTATFLGAGLVPGLIALAVGFVLAEWLLK
jgi:hypothetical protein